VFLEPVSQRRSQRFELGELQRLRRIRCARIVTVAAAVSVFAHLSCLGVAAAVQHTHELVSLHQRTRDAMRCDAMRARCTSEGDDTD
jgi:hypothetical protein